MKRPAVLLLVLLMLLLGVQRTPEANLGTVAALSTVVGGCAYLAATAKSGVDPVKLPPPETPATP